MKEKMNLNAIRRILFVFYAMFLSLTVTAQDLTGIQGTVTDEHGEPVIGATVVEKAQPKTLPLPIWMVSLILRLPQILNYLCLMWVMSHGK